MIRADTGVCVVSKKSHDLHSRVNTSLPALMWRMSVQKPPRCVVHVRKKTAGKLCDQFSGFYPQVMSENVLRVSVCDPGEVRSHVGFLVAFFLEGQL